LDDLQIKLNETEQMNLNQIYRHSINQKETSLFGSIKLNEYCSNPNPFKSEILTGEQQCLELIKLCEFSRNDKWTLLYRGTRDGFGSKEFHSKCDNHSNILTVCKAKQSSFIFGGFTTVSCDSSNRDKLDPNAFIFSLTNKDNQPVKIKINPERHQYAICCYFSFGSTFGGGHDIYITNSANATMKSLSKRMKRYNFYIMNQSQFSVFVH
jgi:hypothetical protein